MIADLYRNNIIIILSFGLKFDKYVNRIVELPAE